jgi:hypothetical protein
MNQHSQSELISDDELLARFITRRDWMRHDGTLRPEAFFPPRDLQLSVTRHGNLSMEQLWQLGRDVANVIAEKRSAGLFGRADLQVKTVTRLNLKTEVAPLPGNPNHAHITGWSSDKSAWKAVLLELANAAQVIRIPMPAGS